MSLRPESLSAKDLDTILGWRQRSHTDFHIESKEERNTFIKIQAIHVWHTNFFPVLKFKLYIKKIF